MRDNFIVSKGGLCFFFPFDIVNPIWSKSDKNKIMKYEKKCQKECSITGNIDLRRINEKYENLITKIKNKIASKLGISNYNAQDTPYLCECLKNEYYYVRGRTPFVYQIQLFVEQFNVQYSSNKIIPCKLILFLNIEKSMGIVAIDMRLDNYSIDDIITIKHLFFKRFEIDCINVKLPIRCRKLNKYSPQENSPLLPPLKTTMQKKTVEIIQKFSNTQVNDLATYSLLEINQIRGLYSVDIETLIKSNQYSLYGLIKADQGWEYNCHKRCRKIVDDFFIRKKHNGILLSGKHGLILDFRNNEYRNKMLTFFSSFKSAEENISVKNVCIDRFNTIACITGVSSGYLKQYLSAIEYWFYISKIYSEDSEDKIPQKIGSIYKKMKQFRTIFDNKNISNDYTISVESYIFQKFGIFDRVDSMREFYNLLSKEMEYMRLKRLNIIMIILSIITTVTALISIYHEVIVKAFTE